MFSASVLVENTPLEAAARRLQQCAAFDAASRKTLRVYAYYGVDPHRAAVVGLARSYNLRGIVMSSPDIRAGVALLIAALSADGKSIIQNIEQIDRGYQHIDSRLQSIGATIRRIDY